MSDADCPLRIAHVIDSLAPSLGGPPAVAMSLSAAQAGLGHDVRLIHHASAESFEPIARATPGFDRVALRQFPSPRGVLDRVLARHALAPLAEAFADVDIVHLHGVWEPLLPRAASVARALGRPYVVTPNGMLKRWALAHKPIRKRVALAVAYRRMLRNAAGIQALNESERSEWEPLGLADRAFVLPNGAWPVNPTTLPPAGTFRAAHPALGDAPFVLFIGRLNRVKGVDVLMEAFDLVAARDARVRLVIAGPDDGERSALEHRRSQSPFADRILFVGPLFGEMKAAALSEATLFVLSSRNEGFSVAVLDALGAGLPVVISTACHFDEVGSSGAGVVCELRSRPIAAAISQILADDVLQSRMADDARRLAASYSWPAIAAASIAKYRDLLSAAESSRHASG